MTNNVCTIVSYNNYEIKVLAFLINQGKSYVTFDEHVDKVDVTKLTSDFDKDALSAKINNAIERAMKVTKQANKEVYLVFDAKEFFYETKSLNGVKTFTNCHFLGLSLPIFDRNLANALGARRSLGIGVGAHPAPSRGGRRRSKRTK